MPLLHVRLAVHPETDAAKKLSLDLINTVRAPSLSPTPAALSSCCASLPRWKSTYEVRQHTRTQTGARQLPTLTVWGDKHLPGRWANGVRIRYWCSRRREGAGSRETQGARENSHAKHR